MIPCSLITDENVVTICSVFKAGSSVATLVTTR